MLWLCSQSMAAPCMAALRRRLAAQRKLLSRKSTWPGLWVGGRVDVDKPVSQLHVAQVHLTTPAERQGSTNMWQSARLTGRAVECLNARAAAGACAHRAHAGAVSGLLQLLLATDCQLHERPQVEEREDAGEFPFARIVLAARGARALSRRHGQAWMAKGCGRWASGRRDRSNVREPPRGQH